jgi:hypothetical protein
MHDASCLQLIERAYSYLRLSGASEADCCRHVQWLSGALADAMSTGEVASAASLNAFWQRLLDEGERLGGEAAEVPVLAPEPVRGSIGYARFGGRAR